MRSSAVVGVAIWLNMDEAAVTDLIVQAEALAFDRGWLPQLYGAQSYADRGSALNGLRRHEEALADFNRALELKPGDAALLAGRGDTYRYLRRPDDALADFIQAVALDSECVDALVGRAAIYQIQNRYEESKADLERALALEPDNTWTLNWRGLAFFGRRWPTSTK